MTTKILLTTTCGDRVGSQNMGPRSTFYNFFKDKLKTDEENINYNSFNEYNFLHQRLLSDVSNK